jgi:hypothetical protein
VSLERRRFLLNNHKFQVATPEEFVRRYGGCRVINKVLIANNGIAGKANHNENKIKISF